MHRRWMRIEHSHPRPNAAQRREGKGTQAVQPATTVKCSLVAHCEDLSDCTAWVLPSPCYARLAGDDSKAGCRNYSNAASNTSSARFENVRMFTTRSGSPVSTVMACDTGPASAMQVWPAASP